MRTSSFLNTIYQRDYFFTMVCSWCLCQKLVDIYVRVYFCALYSVPAIYAFFYASTILFDYHSSVT